MWMAMQLNAHAELLITHTAHTSDECLCVNIIMNMTFQRLDMPVRRLGTGWTSNSLSILFVLLLFVRVNNTEIIITLQYLLIDNCCVAGSVNEKYSHCVLYKNIAFLRRLFIIIRLQSIWEILQEINIRSFLSHNEFVRWFSLNQTANNIVNCNWSPIDADSTRQQGIDMVLYAICNSRLLYMFYELECCFRAPSCI